MDNVIPALPQVPDGTTIVLLINMHQMLVGKLSRTPMQLFIKRPRLLVPQVVPGSPTMSFGFMPLGSPIFNEADSEVIAYPTNVVLYKVAEKQLADAYQSATSPIKMAGMASPFK